MVPDDVQLPQAPRLSQVERAYHEVRDRITYGTYPPGTHLSESTLARLLQMSRTPIREALSRLCEERCVLWESRHGFMVAPITVNDIRNIFQVRSLVETEAAALAAIHATPEEIQGMRDRAPHDYTVGDHGSYLHSLERNLDFHLMVSRSSRNDILVDYVRQGLLQTYRLLSLGSNFELFYRGSSEEHLKLVDAIEQHNAAAARKAIKHHVDRALSLMMESVMNGAFRGVAL